MNLRLRAVVKAVTGRTRHSFGSIVEGAPVEVQRIPAPAWVEIVDEDNGFYLLYFDPAGNCLTDTWHETLEGARKQAEFEFEISGADWQTVEGK